MHPPQVIPVHLHPSPPPLPPFFQVKLLRQMFRDLLGESSSRVDVNTVDGFQGREKDVVIFSCVRAGRGKGRSIGFLSDFRRMNVGITRARSSMLVRGLTRGSWPHSPARVQHNVLPQRRGPGGSWLGLEVPHSL